MFKYVLILTLYNTPGGIPSSYVIDHNMSGQDCIVALESWAGLQEDVEGARLTCETDEAQ